MRQLCATLAALLAISTAALAQSGSGSGSGDVNTSTVVPFPSPTPSPSPDENYYLKTEENETVCAHVQSVLTLYIHYPNEAGESKELTIALSDMYYPHVEGFCPVESFTEIVMPIVFNTSLMINHTLSFVFNYSNKDHKEYDLEVNVTLNTTGLPGFNTSVAEVLKLYYKGIFTVDTKRSYKCNTGRSFKLKLEEDVPGIKVYLRTYKFRAQALQFQNSTTGDFDKSTSCSLDGKSSKVVPIAVGAALAGLVIVVLVAYLIGRFRSRKQNSYEALS